MLKGVVKARWLHLLALAPALLEALRPPLRIVAETADWVVVDKPSGVPCHSAGSDDVLSRLRVDAVARGCSAAAVAEYRLCHRLDDGTSGCLAVAKGRASAAALCAAFRDRTARKAYAGLTAGDPTKKKAVVRGDLVRARRGSWKLARTCARGACACTVFTRTLGLGGAAAGARRLLVARPVPPFGVFFFLQIGPGRRRRAGQVTGKSHQIRVAAKANGAPLLGDARYGGAAADRLYLHAAALRVASLGIDVATPPTEGAAFATEAFAAAWSRVDWAAELDAPLPRAAAHPGVG